MKKLLLILALVSGCDRPGPKIQKDIRESSETILKSMEGKKVIKTRLDPNQLDFVLEDGTLISFYSYKVYENGNVDYHVAPIAAK